MAWGISIYLCSILLRMASIIVNMLYCYRDTVRYTYYSTVLKTPTYYPTDRTLIPNLFNFINFISYSLCPLVLYLSTYYQRR